MTKENTEKLHLLYKLYEQPMYRIAFAVLNNASDAEDAVSDAFMRIIKKLDKIGDPCSSDSKKYIIKIIKNISIDKYRKNKRVYETESCIDDEALFIADDSVNIEDHISENNSENINQLLYKLKETDKQIVLLRCVNELPWKDVSEKLSMSESTVRKRFERARKKIISMKGEMYNEKRRYF